MSPWPFRPMEEKNPHPGPRGHGSEGNQWKEPMKRGNPWKEDRKSIVRGMNEDKYEKINGDKNTKGMPSRLRRRGQERIQFKVRSRVRRRIRERRDQRNDESQTRREECCARPGVHRLVAIECQIIAATTAAPASAPAARRYDGGRGHPREAGSWLWFQPKRRRSSYTRQPPGGHAPCPGSLNPRSRWHRCRSSSMEGHAAACIYLPQGL